MSEGGGIPIIFGGVPFTVGGGDPRSEHQGTAGVGIHLVSQVQSCA